MLHVSVLKIHPHPSETTLTLISFLTLLLIERWDHKYESCLNYKPVGI